MSFPDQATGNFDTYFCFFFFTHVVCIEVWVLYSAIERWFFSIRGFFLRTLSGAIVRLLEVHHDSDGLISVTIRHVKPYNLWIYNKKKICSARV